MIGKVELIGLGDNGVPDEPSPGEWKTVPSMYGKNCLCVQPGDDDRLTTMEMLPADATLMAASKLLREALEFMVEQHPECRCVSLTRPALCSSCYAREAIRASKWVRPEESR